MCTWRIVRAVTGNEVRRIRKQLGLTQAALAKVLGVTASTAARWEQGVFAPREPVARLLRLLLATRGKTGTRR